MAAATPRVAVIGGGLAGTLCSLVLQHRGVLPTVWDQGRQLGGRLAGGAQLLRAADPRLMAVYESMAAAGYLQPFAGRTGVLGTSGGGFLSSAHIPKYRPADDDSRIDRSRATDGGDFCHFVEGSTVPTFVGNLPNLCSNILKSTNIPSVSQATVLGATPGPDGWHLDIKTSSSSTAGAGAGSATVETHQYDGLVIATHDASFAASVVSSIADAEVAAGCAADEPVLQKLQQLATDLTTVRQQGKAPVYTLRATVDKAVPFDAVTIPGSPYVQFLSRSATDDTVWTAVSTTAFAADLLARPDLLDADRAARATETLTDHVTALLAPYDATLQGVSVKRWGAAFTTRSLEAHHDCIALQPWRLSICGDFVRTMATHGTPLEAAALSGLEAGERTAAYFGGMSE